MRMCVIMTVIISGFIFQNERKKEYAVIAV